MAKKIVRLLAAAALLSTVGTSTLGTVMRVDAVEKTTTEAKKDKASDKSTAETTEESKEKTKATDKDKDKTSEKSDKETESESTTDKDQKESETAQSDIDWTPVIEEVQKNLEAEEVEELFVNQEVHSFEGEDVSVQLNGYAYYGVSNFDKDFKIPFDDQNEKGGIILLNLTIKNDSSAPVFPTATFDIKVPGADSFISSSSQLVDEDTSVIDEIVDKEGLAAGESIEGFVVLTVPPSVQELIEADGKATFELPSVYSTDDFSSATKLLKDAKIILPLTEDAVTAVAENSKFYADKTTVDNMGTKTMLVEDSELAQEIEAEGVKITVDGYQITEFEPNTEEAPRFTDFKDGAVLYTFSITVENGGEVPVDLSNIGGFLTLGGMVEIMNQGMLEVSEYNKVAEPGGSGTYYMVFLVAKDMYDKFEGEDMSLAIHPKTAEEFDDVADYDTFTYDIPAKAE